MERAISKIRSPLFLALKIFKVITAIDSLCTGGIYSSKDKTCDYIRFECLRYNHTTFLHAACSFPDEDLTFLTRVRGLINGESRTAIFSSLFRVSSARKSMERKNMTTSRSYAEYGYARSQNKGGGRGRFVNLFTL